MAAVCALATAVATAVVVAGLAVYYGIAEAALLAGVSPETRRVLENLELGMEMTAGRAAEINRVVAGAFVFQIEREVLLALGAFGMLVGALAGFALGHRIAKPIESVSRAVAAIASGDLDARAATSGSETGEPAVLIANFNIMADGLDKAERELAESASAIAHELRTPVTILRARLQAMLDGVFQPSERELAGLIAQTDMLAGIIDNLRVLSLAGAGRLELSGKRVDLAAEAEQVLSAMEPDLREAGLHVETAFEPAFAQGDAGRLRQVVTIFLDNARRYASDGGVVRVETGRTAMGVHMTVLDRGPGLPEGAHETAFDRFWRGEPSRARHSGGSGLGLAVARAIADEHDGRVRARAREGGGVAFSIEIPSA